jgi:hopanoid biosynthesis associated protein HpnK
MILPHSTKFSACMKRLIVNGDDFGYTRGVNRGIVQAFREGILTSATLMANGEAFDDAAELAHANPGLGVGCHLVLVGGRAAAPVSEIPSLADREGKLPKSLPELVIKLASGKLRAAELERELRAQIARLRAAGIKPTHLDTHKHTHLHPAVMRALARVAAEFGIQCVRKPFERLRNLLGVPTRGDGPVALRQSAAAAVGRASAPEFRRLVRDCGLCTPDYFYGIGLTGLLGTRALLRLLARMPEGTGELMCHPGICDDELARAATRLKRQREQELAALTDPAVRRAVEENSIHLISYRELVPTHV